MGFLITTLIFVVVGIIASLSVRICCNRGPSTNLDSSARRHDEIPQLGSMMASAGITASNLTFLGLKISNTSLGSVVPRNSVSFPCISYVNVNINLNRRLYVRSSSVPAAPAMEGLKPAISLSDNALKHLSKMRSDRGEDLCLRIGVKQGGCSGMSYTMDFENRANARPDDSTIEYEGFTIVCDPKSMLFLNHNATLWMWKVFCCRDVNKFDMLQ